MVHAKKNIDSFGLVETLLTDKCSPNLIFHTYFSLCHLKHKKLLFPDIFDF